jgi:hypothetical protein
VKRQLVRSVVVALVGLLAGAACCEPIAEQDAQQLLRLARIEQVLGAGARLGELLCVDEALGQGLLPPSATPAGQRLEDKARRAFEQCRLLQGPAAGDDQRLVTQLRATLIDRVAQLGPVRTALDQCRTPKQRLTAARECIARVLGRAPTTEEVASFSQEGR